MATVPFSRLTESPSARGSVAAGRGANNSVVLAGAGDLMYKYPTGITHISVPSWVSLTHMTASQVLDAVKWILQAWDVIRARYGVDVFEDTFILYLTTALPVTSLIVTAVSLEDLLTMQADYHELQRTADTLRGEQATRLRVDALMRERERAAEDVAAGRVPDARAAIEAEVMASGSVSEDLRKREVNRQLRAEALRKGVRGRQSMLDLMAAGQFKLELFLPEGMVEAYCARFLENRCEWTASDMADVFSKIHLVAGETPIELYKIIMFYAALCSSLFAARELHVQFKAVFKRNAPSLIAALDTFNATIGTGDYHSRELTRAYTPEQMSLCQQHDQELYAILTLRMDDYVQWVNSGQRPAGIAYDNMMMLAYAMWMHKHYVEARRINVATAEAMILCNRGQNTMTRAAPSANLTANGRHVTVPSDRGRTDSDKRHTMNQECALHPGAGHKMNQCYSATSLSNYGRFVRAAIAAGHNMSGIDIPVKDAAAGRRLGVDYGRIAAEKQLGQRQRTQNYSTAAVVNVHTDANTAGGDPRGYGKGRNSGMRDTSRDNGNGQRLNYQWGNGRDRGTPRDVTNDRGKGAGRGDNRDGGGFERPPRAPFEPKEGMWQCSKCKWHNGAEATVCGRRVPACLTPRGGAVAIQVPAETNSTARAPRAVQNGINSTGRPSINRNASGNNQGTSAAANLVYPESFEQFNWADDDDEVEFPAFQAVGTVGVITKAYSQQLYPRSIYGAMPSEACEGGGSSNFSLLKRSGDVESNPGESFTPPKLSAMLMRAIHLHKSDVEGEGDETDAEDADEEENARPRVGFTRLKSAVLKTAPCPKISSISQTRWAAAYESIRNFKHIRLTPPVWTAPTRCRLILRR
jgi:hypothetical protein